MVSATQVIRRLLPLGLALLCFDQAFAQNFFDLGNINLPDLKIEADPKSKVSPYLQTSFFIISLSLIPSFIVCCSSYILARKFARYPGHGTPPRKQVSVAHGSSRLTSACSS